jgi:hypothetical protein
MSQGFTKGTPIDTDPTLSLNSDIVVPSQKAVKSYLAANYQPTLVSATNIKTVNGNSLLGSGDLVIGGGGLTVGTTAISSGTIGRILFQNGGNVLGQDSALFWDNTNKRLGVGATPSTSVRLDVRAQGALSTDIAFRVRNSADTFDIIRANGAGDVFVGQGAGRVNTGSGNTAIGFQSLFSNTSSGSNTAIGNNSLLNSTGASNTAIGFQSLYTNSSGGGNVAIGVSSLVNNTTGNNNVSNGFGSLMSNTTGSNNIADGFYAGRVIADGTTALTITNNSVYLGYNTKALANNQTNQIVIGFEATGLGSNTAVLGNDSITLTGLKGNVAIGATTASAKLDVRAQGALSTDIAFRVRNSADTANILTVNGDGTIIIPTTPKIDTTSGTFLQTNNFGSFTFGSTNSSITGLYDISCFGSNNTLNNAFDSYCILGRNNNVAGMRNIVIGNYNKTSGDTSMRIGHSYGQDTFGGNSSMHFGRAGGGGFLTYSANEVTNFFFNDWRTSQMFRGNGSILLSGKNSQILTDANVTTFMGNGGNTLVVRNHTNVPSTNVTDSFQQYSADIVAGNAAPHFRTENGNIIRLFQGAALTASDGTLANAVTRIAEIQARLQAHGLIA